MKRLLFWFLYALPKNYVSYFLGKIVHCERPRFLAKLIKEQFAKAYNINMAEAELSMDQYTSLGSLFTRRLKPGLRPTGGHVIHPADSVISQAGRIDKDIMIQAKGKFFFTGKLLNSEFSEKFKDGYFITYYLCPTDYHRVHSPVTGDILETQYIPGKLWPVNDTSVNAIKELFAVNERTVSIIKTTQGYCALVMVGATNVGKITLAYEPKIISNQCYRTPQKIKHSPSIPIKVGDEFGTFHMGSTVVMLYEKSFFNDNFKDLIRGPVKLGQPVPGTEWS